MPNASFHGLAGGYARGGAPRARLAIYKACWVRVTGLSLCDLAAIMKAFDDAIHDGVDILSLSLGGPSYYEFPEALHAVANGITVIFAAGNTGPAPRTVSNASPWLMTVASATIDRAFPTILTLGNNEKLVVCYHFISSFFVGRKFVLLHVLSGDRFLSIFPFRANLCSMRERRRTTGLSCIQLWVSGKLCIP